MKVILAILVLLASFQVANAQKTSAKAADPFFDPALRKLGVYLTAPVADQYRRAAAAKFSERAVQAGFSSHEAKVFAGSMATGDIRFEPGGKWGRIASKNADVRISAEPGNTKAGYITSFSTVESATEFLERFSTIKLIVKPAPPRDYKVIVNGEACPATEAGIYKVMPGQSVVNAIRPSKPKCEWQGSIAAGAVQEVNCAL